MDRTPVFRGGKESGEALLERQSLYTVIRVRCPPRAGLWCAWAVGERGEVRIGVLEPAHGEAVISRRFSRNALSPLGRLRRIELRPARAGGLYGDSIRECSGGPSGGAEPPPWKPCAGIWPSADPALRRQFQDGQREGVQDVLERGADGKQYLAFPRTASGPFPLPGLFCFARSAAIGGRDYWIFAFDRRRWPLMET